MKIISRMTTKSLSFQLWCTSTMCVTKHSNNESMQFANFAMCPIGMPKWSVHMTG